MKKITAICLNPSIDMTVKVKELQKGTLNRTENFTFDYGGKGVNVAIALARLEENALLLGRVGSEDKNAFEEKLLFENVETRFQKYKGKVRTNIKLYEKDVLTEINSKGQEGTEKEEEEFEKLFLEALSDSKIVVMTGSIPKGFSINIYGNFIEKARERGIPTVLDADGEALKQGLLAHPTLVKPNLFELEQYLGKSVSTEQELIEGARTLNCDGVLVSVGAKGAYLITKTEAYFAAAPKIEAKSFQGAGDSMVAAMSKAYAERNSLKELLRYSVAAGSAACLETGTKLFQKEKMEALLPQIEVRVLEHVE